MIELLYRLAAVWGPSGREQRVAEALAELVTPHVDTVDTDRVGNLIAVRRGASGSQRIMLTAHMDTPGAMALNIGERGLIHLAPVGGMKAHHALGQRVVWGSGTVGVLQHPPVDDPKELDFKKLFCDIGAISKDEALESVGLGDMCTVVGDLQQMGDVITGPGLDNRAACAVLIQVAAHLENLEHDVVFAFTSQGKTAVRGAAMAAYGAAPHAAFVVDLTDASDVPGGPRTGVRLGSGPTLRLKDASSMAHHGLAEATRRVAEGFSIPLQPEILTGPGTQSETQAVGSAGPGVPVTALGIPARYRGSAAEMVSLRDLHGAADLLLKLLGSSLEL